MSGYKGHILFGIIFVMIIYLVSQYLYFFRVSKLSLLIGLPILFIYPILPDIDIRSSKIRQIVTIVGLLIVLFSILFNEKLLSVSLTLILIVIQFLKHRKFIHTVAAGLLFSLPLLFFNPIVAVLAFAGYFSHLVLDKQVKLY
ncbi:hypothetical protein GOV08_01935 [Candidatus Woesearchaeota archaeon]|nr:hypothetical protein [Candidatus Woesearchaeota archaeon]